MAVKVIDNKTGETHTGKIAVVKEGEVALWSGCMDDKKGGLRGCGRKTVFPSDKISLSADNPDQEIKRL